MQIWKYEIPLTAKPIPIAMPENADLLQVQDQRGAIVIWAIVDPARPRVERVFRIIGTGHTFDLNESSLSYCGTVQQEVFAWHIFEVLP